MKIKIMQVPFPVILNEIQLSISKSVIFIRELMSHLAEITLFQRVLCAPRSKKMPQISAAFFLLHTVFMYQFHVVLSYAKCLFFL